MSEPVERLFVNDKRPLVDEIPFVVSGSRLEVAVVELINSTVVLFKTEFSNFCVGSGLKFSFSALLLNLNGLIPRNGSKERSGNGNPSGKMVAGLSVVPSEAVGCPVESLIDAPTVVGNGSSGAFKSRQPQQ